MLKMTPNTICLSLTVFEIFTIDHRHLKTANRSISSNINFIEKFLILMFLRIKFSTRLAKEISISIISQISHVLSCCFRAFSNFGPQTQIVPVASLLPPQNVISKVQASLFWRFHRVVGGVHRGCL